MINYPLSLAFTDIKALINYLLSSYFMSTMDRFEKNVKELSGNRSQMEKYVSKTEVSPLTTR